MGRYLVIANQTLGGESLLEEVRSRRDADANASFHVVVPATPPDQFTFHTEGEAIAVAKERLEEELERLQGLGVEATGEVGDHDPLNAVRDAVRDEDFDGIILSTLHVTVSRWLRMDLPSRVERHVDLPVTHVEGPPIDD